MVNFKQHAILTYRPMHAWCHWQKHYSGHNSWILTIKEASYLQHLFPRVLSCADIIVAEVEATNGMLDDECMSGRQSHWNITYTTAAATTAHWIWSVYSCTTAVTPDCCVNILPHPRKCSKWQTFLSVSTLYGSACIRNTCRIPADAKNMGRRSSFYVHATVAVLFSQLQFYTGECASQVVAEGTAPSPDPTSVIFS